MYISFVVYVVAKDTHLLRLSRVVFRKTFLLLEIAPSLSFFLSSKSFLFFEEGEEEFVEEIFFVGIKKNEKVLKMEKNS